MIHNFWKAFFLGNLLAQRISCGSIERGHIQMSHERVIAFRVTMVKRIHGVLPNNVRNYPRVAPYTGVGCRRWRQSQGVRPEKRVHGAGLVSTVVTGGGLL